MYWTFHFSDKQPPKSAETAQQEIEVDLNPGGGNAGDESLDNIVESVGVWAQQTTLPKSGMGYYLTLDFYISRFTVH